MDSRPNLNGKRPMPKAFEMVDDDVAKILSRKTEAERLQIAFDMWEFARQMILANLRAEHPDWDESSLTRAVARRMSHGAV
jgi:hypothetical protein